MSRRNSKPLLPILGLTAYFIASVFYVFPSGMPQPGDVLLTVVVVLSILFGQLAFPRDRMLYMVLGLFVAWIVLVNLAWFLVLGDQGFLWNVLFYLFNAMLFVHVVAALSNDFERGKHLLKWSCLALLVFELVYLMVPAEEQVARAIGTFNNPNQLGYWTLLVIACYALVKGHRRVTILDIAALLIGLYLILLSASRAAALSSILLVVLIVVACGMRRNAALVAVGLVVCGVALATTGAVLKTEAGDDTPLTFLVDRFASIEDHERGGLDRGYSRIIEYPGYLVFGAGEGMLARFGDDEGTIEFHSSLGNILFSYGIVGFVLFGALLFAVLRHAFWPSIAYVGPVMLFGMTHLAIRFSLFWLFLGLIYAHAHHRARARISNRHRAKRTRAHRPAPTFADPQPDPRALDPTVISRRSPTATKVELPDDQRIIPVSWGAANDGPKQAEALSVASAAPRPRASRKAVRAERSRAKPDRAKTRRAGPVDPTDEHL